MTKIKINLIKKKLKEFQYEWTPWLIMSLILLGSYFLKNSVYYFYATYTSFLLLLFQVLLVIWVQNECCTFIKLYEYNFHKWKTLLFLDKIRFIFAYIPLNIYFYLFNLQESVHLYVWLPVTFVWVWESSFRFFLMSEPVSWMTAHYFFYYYFCMSRAIARRNNSYHIQKILKILCPPLQLNLFVGIDNDAKILECQTFIAITVFLSVWVLYYWKHIFLILNPTTLDFVIISM